MSPFRSFSSMTARGKALVRRFEGNSALVQWAFLGVVTILGAGLRAYNLGMKSLWYDEAVIYWVARSPIPSMVAENAHGNSAPPLYPFLIHFVTEFATNEVALRSLSWLAGVLAIPVFYWLAQKYVSKGAAIASTTLMAVTPVFVQYSQELREYSAVFLVSALMLLAYGRFKDRGSTTDVLLLFTCFSVGVLLQYGLNLLILSLNLAFLIEVVWLHHDRRLLAKWIGVQVGVFVVVVMVWLSTLRFQFSPAGFPYLDRGYFEGPWTSLLPFLFRQTYDVVLFVFPDPPLAIFLIAVGVVSAAISGQAAIQRSHLVLPFLVAAMAGIAGVYPYVGARQSMHLLPIVYLLCALGFDYLLRVDRRGILLVPLALLLIRASLLPTLDYLRFEGIENLRPLVQRLNAAVLPQDRVFVCHGAVPAFRYYYRGDVGIVVEGAATEEWRKQLSDALMQSPRVWFVASHCGDTSNYIEFASQLREMTEVASTYQAWLFVSSR
jgi:4-amino-4-deoxy-L-arabinose transferase-like glycosyltransferase